MKAPNWVKKRLVFDTLMTRLLWLFLFLLLVVLTAFMLFSTSVIQKQLAMQAKHQRQQVQTTVLERIHLWQEHITERAKLVASGVDAACPGKCLVESSTQPQHLHSSHWDHEAGALRWVSVVKTWQQGQQQKVSITTPINQALLKEWTPTDAKQAVLIKNKAGDIISSSLSEAVPLTWVQWQLPNHRPGDLGYEANDIQLWIATDMSAYREVLRAYYGGFYLIFIGSIVLSTLLALVASQMMTKPLHRLVNRMEQVSLQEGDLRDAKPVPTQGFYEVEHLSQAFNRLLQRIQQQGEQRDEFVATLTHDLKVPLLAEKQTLRYLQDQTYGPLTEEQLDVLSTLKRSNEGTLNLMNQLLEVSRYEAGSVQLQQRTVDVLSLVEGCVRDLEGLTLSKKLNVQIVAKPAKSLNAWADPIELKRVIQNLLSNAVVHTARRGTITVELHPTAASQNIHRVSSFEHSTLKDSITPGEGCLVSLKDNGRGIDKQTLNTLFSRFSSHKSRNPMSMGLGLYNAAQVIKAHQGHIWVESDEGEGTAVILWLPLHMTPINNAST